MASLWEIVVKADKGALPINNPPQWLESAVRSVGAEVLPIRAEHAYEVHRLPAIHKDPFDRIIVAQAAVEGWRLISSDETVRRYAVNTIW